MRNISAYTQDQVPVRAFKVGNVLEGYVASAYYSRDNGAVGDIGGEQE